jgi:hypothetical protein
MPFDRLIFRQHAFDQMIARFITEVEVRQVLEVGTMVEEYPNDLPYPSYLILGYVDGRPLHIVASDNEFDKVTIVRTMYEPDAARWDSTFTKRKRS